MKTVNCKNPIHKNYVKNNHALLTSNIINLKCFNEY